MASFEDKRKQIIAQTRADIKKEKTRKDILIIHAIRSLDTLDKTVNLLNEQSKSWQSQDLEDKDLERVTRFNSKIEGLRDEREELQKYLEELMGNECPNIRSIAGSLVGARLMALAGSLKRLAGFPASTIQVLGAEKALFAHLEKGSPSPKYGAIFAIPKVRNSPKNNRGKIARKLASKISMAAKIDYFKGDYIGDKLIKELNEEISRLN
jgi:nucleolar protein 56